MHILQTSILPLVFGPVWIVRRLLLQSLLPATPARVQVNVHQDQCYACIPECGRWLQYGSHTIDRRGRPRKATLMSLLIAHDTETTVQHQGIVGISKPTLKNIAGDRELNINRGYMSSQARCGTRDCKNRRVSSDYVDAEDKNKHLHHHVSNTSILTKSYSIFVCCGLRFDQLFGLAIGASCNCCIYCVCV